MGAGASVLTFEEYKEVQHVYESRGLSSASLDEVLESLRGVLPRMAESKGPVAAAAANKRRLADEEEKKKKKEEEEEDEGHWSRHEFGVGDVVKVKDAVMHCFFEGVISAVCKPESRQVKVDFGDSEETVDISHCSLVLRATDCEVDDIVEVRPPGMALYFRGRVVRANVDGTFDIKIDSDDPEDFERGVHHENIRKLMTSRQLATLRWNKATNAVKAALAFSSHGRSSMRLVGAKIDSINAKRPRLDGESESSSA